MRISVGSDLHLEFGILELENKDNADVLVLAGDVVVASKINPKWEWFFENCSNEFKDVIYIMGNHEHYHGDFNDTSPILRSMLSPYKNIHFLNNEHITIGDVTFFGATFWTDMNNRDPYVMNRVGKGMNDFLIVGNEDHIFNTKDAAQEHEFSLNCLKLLLESHKEFGDGKVVVVAHHAPSIKSVHEMYKGDILNYGYYSDMEKFIGEHPEIKLWIHGHTHKPFDYKIGETRVLCNPRGYIGYEREAWHFALKTVEV